MKVSSDLEEFESVEIRAKADDPDRSIIYTGFALSCCLVEVFGDTRLIEVENDKAEKYYVAHYTTTRQLKLLDLRGEGANRVGANATIAKCFHPISQRWSRLFYEEAVFGNVDGLLYYNGHNDEEAIALYERGKDALSVTQDAPLTDKAFHLDVLRAAKNNNYVIAQEYLDIMANP